MISPSRRDLLRESREIVLRGDIWPPSLRGEIWFSRTRAVISFRLHLCLREITRFMQAFTGKALCRRTLLDFTCVNSGVRLWLLRFWENSGGTPTG